MSDNLNIKNLKDELNKVKAEEGKYDKIENVINIINYIQNFKLNFLLSREKNKSELNLQNSFLNENENCKTIICKYINKIEENNNLILNLDGKKTLFTNVLASLTTTLHYYFLFFFVPYS